MLAKWTGEVVGEMHIHQITITDLAKRMGVTRPYLSNLLNCHRTPPHAEWKCREALAELVAEKEAPHECTEDS